MIRLVAVLGLVVGVVLAVAVSRSLNQDASAGVAEVIAGAAQQSHSAMYTEADALAGARALIPDYQHPTSPTARLLPAYAVGEWKSICTGWASKRPHWLVAHHTDGYHSGLIEVNPAEETFGPVQGVYHVFDANTGMLRAWGDLYSSTSGAPSMESIAALQPTEDIDSISPDTEFYQGPSAGQDLATYERACRERWW